MKFSKASTLKSIRFAFNGGKNHFYHSKLQTTTDGENWTDVPDATSSARRAPRSRSKSPV